MSESRPFHPVRSAAVLAVAVGLFGVPFGVLAVATGVPPEMAVAMSALVFGGGAQFAAVGVLAAGGSVWAGVASGLLLNGRYAALGLALADRFPGSMARRLVAAHLVIDESAALALAAPDPRAAERAFWWTGGLLFLCWNVGTALGAYAGALVGDPTRMGLDAAFPAMFLALLAPLLDSTAARRSAVAGGLVALVLLPVAPPGVPVIAAALGAFAALPGKPRPGELREEEGR